MKEVYDEILRINKIDPAIASERLCKLFEESGELAQAVNKTIGRKKITGETKEEIVDNICEEAADTIQCVISLIDTYGITLEQLLNKMIEKNIKWEEVAKKRLEEK